MAKLLKLRRGTTTQHGSFTGAEGEVTIDTDKDTAVVHDGQLAGGRPLAREDLNNVSSSTIAGRLSNDSIAPAKIGAGTLPSDVTVASANLVDGTIVNADIASNAGIAGTKLENSGVTAGSYGSSSAIPIVTVDAQGLVTAASTTAIDSTTIANGTSNVAVANNGDITATRSGTARLVVDGDGVDVTGNITATGNATISGTNLNMSTAYIDFSGSLGSAPTTAAAIYRPADNSLAVSTGNAQRLLINNAGASVTGNLDVSNGVDVTGAINATGDIKAQGGDVRIEGSQPGVHFTDTDNNDDFLLYNNNGILKVYDSTDGADRFTINSSGTVGVNGNLDVGAGIDVTGNITVTGNVDGVDVANLKTAKDSLSTSNGVIKTGVELASGVIASTQGQSDNSTKVATTAYVRTAITNAQAFPSGTKMLFQQTSAPTGWTKVTSGVNNKALRVVSGSAGSGGNVAFTTVFAARGITANSGNATAGGNISVANTTAGGNVSISNVSTSGTVNSHTLSTNEMPSHYHNINGNKHGNYYGWEANHSGIYGLNNRSYDQQGQNNRTSTNAGRVESTGGGGGHSHGFTGSSHTHNGSLSGTAHTHNATFSGSAHNHSISVSNLDMQAEYLDVIIAEKD